MFESLPPPDLAAELRASAAWPIGAVVLAQLYDIALSFLNRRIPWLFWLLVFLLLFALFEGLSRGIVLLWKRRSEIEGPTSLSLLLWLGASLLCGWCVMGML